MFRKKPGNAGKPSQFIAGAFGAQRMAVVPCSMKTLAGIDCPGYYRWGRDSEA